MASDLGPDPASHTVQQTRFVSQLTRNCFAMVLEGPRSNGLHELTDWRSKPAVSFGGKFRLIDFALSNCVNSGIRRVGVATQYRAQSLIRHLQLGWSFLDGRLGEFIEIMPAQQQVNESQWYRGTADAVFQNWREIRRSTPDYVLILSGDHIYRMDYGRLLAAHVARKADLTITTVQTPQVESSKLGRITHEKMQGNLESKNHTSSSRQQHDDFASAATEAGIYVFNTDFLYEQLAMDATDSSSSHDFSRDVIPRSIQQGRVCHQRFEECHVGGSDKPPYWSDVRTLDSYWTANMDLIHVDPDLNLYDDNWPIWTWQPQRPPAKFSHDERKRCGTALDSMIADGCIINGATVRRSLLSYDVRVQSQSTVEDCIVQANVQIGQNCMLRKCILDKNCTIEDNTQIGIDSTSDSRKFHVTPLGVTLVTRVMLGQEREAHD
jgi:glucose-1-phosphate adenylyltransferase